MGPSNDKNAVLDENLQVRGVKGLRVADTSVMPLLNQGHTQMPAYAIGEKAADLIKQSATFGSVKVSGLAEKLQETASHVFAATGAGMRS